MSHPFQVAVVACLTAALSLGVQVAHAAPLTGEADGDSLVLRGEVRITPTAVVPNVHERLGLLRNCVPLGDGRLRCYTGDLLAPGIEAVTVEPGADVVTAEELAGAVLTEFRRLPLEPGGIRVQPSRGWTLVNVHTIFMSNAVPQTFQIAVLGIPLTVRATPIRYVWSFGDGTAPLATTDAGSPWPDPTLTHVYQAVGTQTATLRTEWAGEYQIAGSGEWQQIDGLATTNESTPPLEVRSATNALVTDG